MKGSNLRGIEERVTALLRGKPGEQFGLPELMRLCGVGRHDRSLFREILDRLSDDGMIRQFKGGRFGAPDAASVLTGRLSVHPDGYGFVTPDQGGEDLFIPARYLRGSFHGDLVEVGKVRGRAGKTEGRIVRTLERGVKKVTGILHEGGGALFVVPADPRLTRDILIPPAERGAARHGEMVVCEIVSFPDTARGTVGRIVEVLGPADDPKVEALAAIRSFELPDEFSPQALAEARAVPTDVTEAQLAGRADLREMRTVTIDGETARDFDDAVAVRREQAGRIRLWVSIADVAYYVRPDSPLDRDAYLRGTSVYFPDRCLPMLPEELSNGICSLNPRVDRLTMTAEMLFDTNCGLVERRLYPSVIRSAARLTYTGVSNALTGEMSDESAELLPDLRLMEELARRLMARRRQRGSIDFDLPEPQIVLDLQGATEAIVRAERTIAHRIIEEFMLAANEAVATFLGEHIPALYRIHEPPDPVKLADFRDLIRGFGYDFPLDPETVAPADLQRLLEQADGKPEERMINEVLLRCMQQARYSAENHGHFGLASNCYTHFTSPIRRYPDLVVHRLLKRVLSGKVGAEEKERLAESLPEIATHTSARERIAMEAERAVVELKKVQFMREKVGEEYEGFVTGVSSSGFFVELVDLFVQGFVAVATLPEDHYRYMEKQHSLIGMNTRQLFRIGDRLRVIVAQVSIERRRIDFVVAGSVLRLEDLARGEGRRREHEVRESERKKPTGSGRKGDSGERHGGGRKTGRGGRGRRR